MYSALYLHFTLYKLQVIAAFKTVIFFETILIVTYCYKHQTEL